MPLYHVTFAEHGGYTVTTRVRAAEDAPLLVLALSKIWGEQAYWRGIAVETGEDRRIFEGRVYEDTDSSFLPIVRLGLATVTITRARLRRAQQTLV